VGYSAVRAIESAISKREGESLQNNILFLLAETIMKFYSKNALMS
jgi:hypothetical protein